MAIMLWPLIMWRHFTLCIVVVMCDGMECRTCIGWTWCRARLVPTACRCWLRTNASDWRPSGNCSRAWCRQRVGAHWERAQATGGRLGTVPERNSLPHRPPHGPQTRPYQILLFVSVQGNLTFTYLHVHLAWPYGITSNFSSRAFSVSAPSTWNSLPVNIHSVDTLSSFKRQLKAHLFQSAFIV